MSVYPDKTYCCNVGPLERRGHLRRISWWLCDQYGVPLGPRTRDSSRLAFEKLTNSSYPRFSDVVSPNYMEYDHCHTGLVCWWGRTARRMHAPQYSDRDA